MKKIILPLFVVLSLMLVTSCSSDSDDDTNPIDDLPANVTYTNTVKGIIDGNCISCHGNPTSNSAPMSLTTLANVIPDAPQIL